MHDDTIIQVANLICNTITGVAALWVAAAYTAKNGGKRPRK